MHELSIAGSIIRETERRLREAGVPPGDARLIRVRVGDLSGVDAGALAEIMRELLPRSALAGATAEIARDPARIVCALCGELDAATPFRLACPSCGADPESVHGGRDVVVESVEAEDTAAEDTVPAHTGAQSHG